jgi:hypothetical protein
MAIALAGNEPSSQSRRSGARRTSSAKPIWAVNDAECRWPSGSLHERERELRDQLDTHQPPWYQEGIDMADWVANSGKRFNATLLAVLFASCALIGRGDGSRAPVGPHALLFTVNLSVTDPVPFQSMTIAKIQVVGQPVKVWDHSNKVEPLNFSDAPVSAWREADGTVNLMLPTYEAYRMRGPDLEHLTLDPKKLYSSTQTAMQIPEDHYNYRHWLIGPYSLDGQNFYSLAHSEWYASLLDGDHDWHLKGYNGKPAMINSWVTTVNSFVSADGGASWRLNVVDGNHVVAKPGYHWTGSLALSSKAYMHAWNPTGLQQITRMIKEGDYYYALGNYYHRDFTQIDPAARVYQAPMDKEGFVLIRTNDFTNPNGWHAWAGGSTYEPVSKSNFKPFYPQRNGSSIRAWSPTFLFDTNAQTFIVTFAGDRLHDAVYYMTTKSLANPSWSDAVAILGTQELVTDPARGLWVGFTGANYPSMIDSSSSGFNFEFTSSGNPWLFFSTAPGLYGDHDLRNRNDVYRVQLQITYDTPGGRN